MDITNYNVYKHTFPNNKVYIGISCQKYLSQRWRMGEGYKTQFVYYPIRKYGWKNIKHEVLYNNLTKEEASKKEVELILLYKSNQKEYGYNIEMGGINKGEVSYETRLKLRNCRLGKKLSEKTKKKLSLLNKGKKLTDYTKCLISAKAKGRKYSVEHNNKIKSYSLNRPQEHNLKISLSKKGKPKSLEQKIKASKPVFQLCDDGRIINRFYGLHDAYRKTGISFKNIHSCCVGKRNKAGGFRWVYEQDYNKDGYKGKVTQKNASS